MRAWRRGDRPSQVLWKQSARSLAGGGTHRSPSSITIGQVSDVSDPQ